MKNLSALPIVGVLRGGKPDSIARTCQAAVDGGLRTLEITLNGSEPFAQIKAARSALDDSIELGAGTVLTVEDAKRAVDAGAEFIVTPAVIPEVIQFCVESTVPVIPGAMTPTESFAAHSAGATMVKVFPASVLGPEYLMLLRGPFPDLRLLVTGGINLDNATDYLKAGAEAIGIGSELFRKDKIKKGDWESLKQKAARYVKTVTEFA